MRRLRVHRYGIHRVAGTECRERRDFKRYREFHLRTCDLWRNVPCKGRKRQRDAAANIRRSIRQLHALPLGAMVFVRFLWALILGFEYARGHSNEGSQSRLTWTIRGVAKYA